MKRHLVLAIIILSLPIFGIACSTPSVLSSKEEAFLQIFPEGTFSGNDLLELRVVTFSDSERILIGETISIWIENISHKTIVFPADYGSKIFSYDDSVNTWWEVEDETIRSAEREITIYPETDLSKEHINSTGFSIHPVLVNSGKSITVRVVVIGEILEDNELSGRKIGSYIDIVFEPGDRTPVGTSFIIIEEMPGVYKVLPGGERTPSVRTPTTQP